MESAHQGFHRPNRGRSQPHRHQGRGWSNHGKRENFQYVVKKCKEDQSPSSGVSLESKPLNASDQAHEEVTDSPSSSSSPAEISVSNETLSCDLLTEIDISCNQSEKMSPFSHGDKGSRPSPMRYHSTRIDTSRNTAETTSPFSHGDKSSRMKDLSTNTDISRSQFKSTSPLSHTDKNNGLSPMRDFSTKIDTSPNQSETVSPFSYGDKSSGPSPMRNLSPRINISRNQPETTSPFGNSDKSSRPSLMREAKSPVSDGKYENSEESEVFDIFKQKNSAHKLNRSLLEINRERRKIVEIHTVKMLRPGMVLLKGYIPLREQVQIVKRCRDLGIGPGGFYQPGYKDGAKLHLNMMCLGKNWDPETGSYGDYRPSDGSKPPGIPAEFYQLVENAIRDSRSAIMRDKNDGDAAKLLPWMRPDICLANFYSTTGRLGLHQDRDESQDSIRKGLPVVSFSIGDSADFSYDDRRDVERAEQVCLESGDVLLFGGPSRNIFHGVTAIKPGSAPKALTEQTNLRPGRLNLTFRQY